MDGLCAKQPNHNSSLRMRCSIVLIYENRHNNKEEERVIDKPCALPACRNARIGK
jgi:hypothetical protein